MREINNPIIEVWVKRDDPETFFMVREKRPPTGGNPHEVWIVDAFSPDDGLLPGEEAYAENLQEAATLVWRETDGTLLPEQYRIEIPEE